MKARLPRLLHRGLLLCTVGILALVVGQLAFPQRCHAELVDRIVAIVDDDIILQSDLEQALAPVRRQLEKSGYSDVQQKIVLENEKKKIIEGLIDEKLTKQRIKRYKITVSDEAVDNSIERIKTVNNLNDEDLKRVLKMEGLTYDAYRDQVKTQMLQARLINLEVKSKIVVTDEDVKAYYEANRSQYAGQTKYHLRQILLRVESPLKTERERVYKRMEAIYRQLESGASFTALAEQYSEAATASDGGDLGSFESRLLAPKIREALQGLKPGQFTPIIDTEQGYQVFLVEAITSTGRSLKEAAPEIQEKLLSKAREEKFQAWLKEMRQHAHIEILE